VDFYLLTTAQGGDAEELSSTWYPYYGNHTLPVRTSPESLFRAMKAYASSSQDDDYIGFQITDPFELAEMIEDLKVHGLQSLVFDPHLPLTGNCGSWIPYRRTTTAELLRRSAPSLRSWTTKHWTSFVALRIL
jgi:hypothetical protein